MRSVLWILLLLAVSCYCEEGFKPVQAAVETPVVVAQPLKQAPAQNRDHAELETSADSSYGHSTVVHDTKGDGYGASGGYESKPDYNGGYYYYYYPVKHYPHYPPYKPKHHEPYGSYSHHPVGYGKDHHGGHGHHDDHHGGGYGHPDPYGHHDPYGHDVGYDDDHAIEDDAFDFFGLDPILTLIVVGAIILGLSLLFPTIVNALPGTRRSLEEERYSELQRLTEIVQSAIEQDQCFEKIACESASVVKKIEYLDPILSLAEDISPAKYRTAVKAAKAILKLDNNCGDFSCGTSEEDVTGDAVGQITSTVKSALNLDQCMERLACESSGLIRRVKYMDTILAVSDQLMPKKSPMKALTSILKLDVDCSAFSCGRLHTQDNDR